MGRHFDTRRALTGSLAERHKQYRLRRGPGTILAVHSLRLRYLRKSCAEQVPPRRRGEKYAEETSTEMAPSISSSTSWPTVPRRNVILGLKSYWTGKEHPTSRPPRVDSRLNYRTHFWRIITSFMIRQLSSENNPNAEKDDQMAGSTFSPERS